MSSDATCGNASNGQEKEQGCSQRKLLAAPGVSHGTVPRRPPQPFLQKKQQDEELGEKISARGTAGPGTGMGSSQGGTGMEGQEGTGMGSRQGGQDGRAAARERGTHKSSTVPG